MKTKRAILVLLATLTFLPLTYAQLNKANKLFQHYRYAEAIPFYTKAAKKEQIPRKKSRSYYTIG